VESADVYLRTVVTRLFLDRGRGHRSREHTVSEVLELPAADQLSPSQHAILVLRYGLDLPVEQVAGILRCSPGNMKNPAARNAELQNGVREIMAEPGRVLVRRAGTIRGATAGVQDAMPLSVV
jgi:DNA-directed RNA polymerase specialized sigma24 family protein